MRFLVAASCFFLSLSSWANPRIKQPLIARDDSFLAAESSLAAVLSLQTAAIVTTQAVSETPRVDEGASEESSSKLAVLVISDWSLGCWEHGGVNVVEFFYHGSQVLAIGLKHPSGDVTWTHAIGRGPLGPCFLKDLTGQGADYFIFTDHLGTPFAWFDPDTGQTTYTPFNPWGELLATPTSGYTPYEHGNVPTSGFNLPTFEVFDVTPLGLAGHIYDEKTGLVYMHHRYLHPRLGHFLTPDFRAPDIYDPSTFTEPYAYAAGNPVMYWDPDGLDEEAFLKGALKESAKEIPIPIVNSLNGKLILFFETEGSLLDKTKAVLVQPVVDLKNTYQAIQETRENYSTAMAIHRFMNPAWNIYEGWDRAQNVIQIMSTVPPEFWTEELGVEFVGSANQTAQGVGGTALVAYGGGKVLLATPATIRAVMQSFKYRGIDMAALDAHIAASLEEVAIRNTRFLTESPGRAALPMLTESPSIQIVLTDPTEVFPESPSIPGSTLNPSFSLGTQPPLAQYRGNLTPTQPVLDHIRARGLGGHPTRKENLFVRAWSENSRKGWHEGNYWRLRKEYISEGLTPEQAEWVLEDYLRWIESDIHATPYDPVLLDSLPPN